MSLSVANHMYLPPSHWGQAVFRELLFLDIERRIKWNGQTLLQQDITCKIVFMLLREMPQGRRGQDPVGRTPGPCPDLNSRCYCFHWYNILSFSLRFCSSNSFSKHSLSVYVVPGTVVGASVKKAFMGLTILVVGERNYKPK